MTETELHPLGPAALLAGLRFRSAALRESCSGGFRSHAAELAVARLLEHLAQSCLSGLCAEAETHLPGTTSSACRSSTTPCRAARPSGSRRCSSARPSSAIGSTRSTVPPGARCSRSVPSDPDGVAHVVEAVEEADEVVGPGVALGVARPRTRVRSATPASSARGRRFDRRAWKSNPWIVDVRVRVRHARPPTRRDRSRRRRTAPPSASLASTPSSAGIHVGREEGTVPGAEEPLGPAEQARMVITPAQRAVTAERVADLGHVDEHRDEHVHASSHERRRGLVGEDHRGLVRQRVRSLPAS